MADGTKIEWTEATWNPITGCSVVSPGCTNCYAMKLAGTRMQHHPSRAGLTRDSKAGPVWTGEVRFNEQWLDQPLRWKRPRLIFVCAHGDPFHENVPDAWIDRVFAVMALAPQHTFQVLTKRAERMRDYVSGTNDQWHGNTERFADRFNAAMDWNLAWINKIDDMPWPLPNVWLGVSVEDQARADERIPHLLATPAAVRWVSAEPLLGPIDMTRVASLPDPADPEARWVFDALQAGSTHLLDIGEGRWDSGDGDWHERIDWIVAGGESGPGARPMHPAWSRALRDQCAAAGVAYFHKQWGDWLPDFEEAPGRPDDDPEQSRFATCVWDDKAQRWDETNGSWTDTDSWTIADDYWQPEQPMTRVGKKAAGALLDGVEWRQMPERR